MNYANEGMVYISLGWGTKYITKFSSGKYERKGIGKREWLSIIANESTRLYYIYSFRWVVSLTKLVYITDLSYTYFKYIYIVDD